MADITSKYDGNVSNEGQVNWRGDQVSVVQGGQSIYDSSTVQLADLGSRKVVGDRVFRYAKSKGAIGAGMTCQYGGETLSSTAVAASSASNINIFTITAATAIVKDTYAEGYLLCVAGATDSNVGMIYKIKSQALGSSAGTCKLTLYDEIKEVIRLTSTWSVYQNPYINVDTSTANGAALGVCPIDLTTGDYFWLQTWGPACVGASAAAGTAIVNSVSGLATLMAAAGYPIGVAAALETGGNTLVFLTVAP